MNGFTTMSPEMRDELASLAKHLAAKGRLIEAGWIGCRLAWVPPDAPDVQIQAMRDAYMAGAQHLFASLNDAVSAGEKVTNADLRMLEKIAAELKAFYLEIRRRQQ